MWIKGPRGCFSIKSAYKGNQDQATNAANPVNWQPLWKLIIQERVKMLLWRIGFELL